MAGDKDLNRNIKIFIDGSQAAQGIEPIKKSIADLEYQIANLSKSEADYEAKSNELKKKLATKNRALQNYKVKIAETDRILKNLSGATYKELIAVQTQVRKQLREAVPGTQQYTTALEQNKRVATAVTAAQKEMRVEVGCQGTTFGKAANLINKYAGLFTTTVASITGLSFAIRKSVNAYAQMEEAESQVIKYTGMTKEQVKDLNEEFKLMDTRTPREKLNALAGDAGRLGITGKDAVLEFVDAADKINVALGEDLGEDAVKNIGKLAQMFGEDERLGLRGAMLATGSAINEVAQNSSAAEAYLVAFTARVAGAANQAKVSQGDILGYASVLDQNMQQQEMASSAFQKLMLKMYEEPAKFAKIAGQSVEEFTTLIKKDANEAILRFLETLNKKGGLDRLAPMFKDMGLDGVRAAGVISTMAGKVDDIRIAQNLANEAYQDGTSIIKEYNVQNNTVQAGLDKAKKKFLDISIALGEKMTPLMSKLTSSTSLLIRALVKVVEILLKYSTTLITVSSIMAAYIIALQAEVMWSKLVMFWNEQVIVSFKKLHTVILRHPLGALITAMTIVIAYLHDLGKEMTEAARHQKMLNDLMSEASIQVKSETTELETLLKVARDKTVSDDERCRAIQRINEISPEYLGNLSLENINTAEADIAVKKYTASLIANAKAKALVAKIDELESQKTYLEANPGQMTAWYDPLVSGISSVLSDAERAGRTVGTLFTKGSLDGWNEQTRMEQNYATNALDAWHIRYTDKMKQIISDQELLRTELENVVKETLVIPVNPVIFPIDDEDEDDKKRKQNLEKEKAAYTQRQAELTKLYASGKDQELQTEQQYNARMLDLKKEYLQKVITLSGEGSSDAANAEKQLAELQLQERKASIERAIAEENTLYQQQQRELKEAFLSQNNENLKTQEDYEEAREQLNIIHLQRTLEIAGLEADARKKVEEQLLDFQLKCMKELEDSQTKKDKKEKEDEKAKAKELEKQYRQKFDRVRGYADEFGDALGQVIAGQEDAISTLGDAMVDIVFDVLNQMIDAWMTELIAKSIVSTAEGGMTAIGSKGLAGIAEAAAIAAAIGGLLATAKAGLKSLFSNGKKTSSGSSYSDSSNSSYNRVAVTQHATGRYDVIGSDDNKLYREVPYLGPAPTGIVRSPALISENGAELIVNAEDLMRLQRHVNYPLVLQAINDSRTGKMVPQHEVGRYPIDSHPNQDSPSQAEGLSPELVRRLTEAIIHLNTEGVPSYVVLSDLERKQELRSRSRRYGSKKG